MIVAYSMGKNTSDRNVIEWFDARKMIVYKKRINNISKEDLLHILKLSEQGLLEILKSSTSAKAPLKSKLDIINRLNFNESLNFILKHPEVLRSPIVFDEKHLLIGYNSDEIRQFIPQCYRKKY